MGAVDLLKTYGRALLMLRAEGWLAILLALANAALALTQLAEPYLFGRVVDALAHGSAAFPLIGAWAFLGLFGILAGVLVAVFADRLAHRQRLYAIATAFDRAITLPLSYHARTGSGTVIRNVLAGANELFGLWLGFLREQLAAFVNIVLLVPALILLDWRVALVLGTLAVLYTAANAFVVRRTSRDQNAVERLHSAVAGRVVDAIGNVPVVQSYARAEAESRGVRDIMGELLTAQYPVLTWWGTLAVLTRSASTLAMVSVLAIGAVLASRGELSVGSIVSFVAFASLLIGKLDQLSGFVARAFVQAPTLASYFALIDEPAAIADRPGAHDLPKVAGAVAFEHVSFAFEDGNQGLFDLDFKVPAGTTVAVVGPTGAGKTTALALLQRLRDPHKGAILIDGVDIREVTLTSLRRSIAVVFQDAGLFNRSIQENILVGRPAATEPEVEAAARAAEAGEFIAAKSDGYATLVGERGALLSGGERQRIAIARAILKDAPILLLDEATSALDTETEAKIKRALDRLRKGRTTFIIAHRLSTVAGADLILVLDKGRIVERGSFSELAKAGGLFARLLREGDFHEPTVAPPPSGSVPAPAPPLASPATAA